MKNLFIDACPRSASRTRYLAEVLLQELEGETTHLKLTEEALPVIDEAAAAKRSDDGAAGNFSDSLYLYAKQFAEADRIIIAAPFWDLSFPALLKQYIEAIMVTGITFRYSEQGFPVGLCKADQLFYVTTAGGPLFDDSFGYGYIRALVSGMLGIPNCVKFAAENLDIIGTDADAILEVSAAEIRTYLQLHFPNTK